MSKNQRDTIVSLAEALHEARKGADVVVKTHRRQGKYVKELQNEIDRLGQQASYDRDCQLHVRGQVEAELQVVHTTYTKVCEAIIDYFDSELVAYAGKPEKFQSARARLVSALKECGYTTPYSIVTMPQEDIQGLGGSLYE